MNTYHKLGAFATAAVVLSVAGVAMAQNVAPDATTTPSQDIAPIAAPEAQPAPTVVDIDGNGNALVRGVVQSTGTDSITISSWGGIWTIRTSDASTVTPAGAGGAADLSAIQSGDFVGVEGTVAMNESATLDATFVRDWTTHPYTGPDAPTSTATPSVVEPEGGSMSEPTEPLMTEPAPETPTGTSSEPSILNY